MITAVTTFPPSSTSPSSGGLSRRTRTNRARNNWRIAEQQRDQTLRALQSEIAQNYQQMLGYGKEFVQASKKKRGLRAGLQRRRRQVRPGHGFGARPSDRRQQPVAGPLRTVARTVAIHYQNAPGRVLQRCAPDPLTKNRK
ncbi:MAG: TolC family protein [Alistipes onderdonkii]